jgi:hypothetical protein
VGVLISLDAYRDRRGAQATAVSRLDAAVARLDPLVTALDGRLTTTIERELLAIAHAVRAGRVGQAAERAERLEGLLQHPAASG